MSVRSWQIFYREIDGKGNITFRGTRPLKVIFKEQQAKNALKRLRNNAAVNQAYVMHQVAPSGAIEATE